MKSADFNEMSTSNQRSVRALFAPTQVCRFYIGLFLLLMLLPVYSANVNYSFNAFTVKNGLAHSSVTSIVEDKVGSYWIGTQNGLTRILGNEVVNYRHINGNNASILSDLIVFVAKDKQDGIWIGTNQGISKYIEASDTFEPLKYNAQTIMAYSYQFQEDTFLIGGLSQIYKYNSRDGKAVPLVKPTEEDKMEYHFIFHYDQNIYLIANYYKGIYWLDASTGKLSPFADIEPNFECSNVYIDSSRRLWVAPYKNGLRCYSLEGNGKLLKSYTSANSELSENAVTAMMESKRKLWISTDGGGINILDADTDTFSHILHSDNDASSIPSNNIKMLYEDSFNNIWAGTVKNGLIEIRKGFIRYFSAISNGRKWNADNQTIAAICEDKEGYVWLGIEHDGISRYAPRNHTFQHYSLNNRKSVMSIVEYDEKRLLVAIYADGIYWFDKKTGKLTRFLIGNGEDDKRVGESSIGMRLLKSADGNIHIYGSTIYKFNTANSTFQKIECEGTIHPNLLNAVANDSLHTIAFDNQCIYEIRNADFSIRSIYADARNEIKAVAAWQDELYICDGQGLKKFNYVTQKEEVISIPFNMRVDVLSFDEAGRLWIVGNDAIVCYWVKEKKMVILSEADGFRPNSFFPNTILRSKLGYLYLGGSNGVLQVDENIPFNEGIEEPEPYLMAVHVAEEQIIGEIEEGIQQFSLPWNYSSVSFRITVKEQDIFRKKHVRYTIRNNAYYSVIENASNRLYLPTLPSGKYSVCISCYSKEGKWTEPKKMFQLSVLPPWWKTWWFTMILVIASLALVFAFIKFMVNAKKRKLVETLNIEKKKVAEEKVNFLINMSHELRTPLTLIYAPLKRLFETQKDSVLQEQLSKILMQVSNMTQLINIILDVRKLEVGATSLQIGAYHLNEWVRSIAEDFREELYLKHISLEYELSEEIGLVNFDKEKCKIILSNFLMNALKYSDSEGIVTVRTALAYPSRMVRVSVSDQGIGLEQTDQSKLFSPFYQGKHDIKGNGIGLSYSKLLIEMQKGKIGFSENPATAGATFYFELPPDLPCGRSECERKEYMSQIIDISPDIENLSQGFALNKYSILLVDDAIDLLDYLKHFLKPYFKKVHVATNGEAALGIIKRDLPDMVVSDVMMPGMDGFQLCRLIKTDLAISHIPVILLTALQETQSLSIGYKMGADAYVPKPFDTSFLLTIMKNQLCMREAIKKHCQNVNVIEMSQKCTFSNADELFMTKLNEFIKEHMDNPELDMDMINKHMCMSHSALYSKIKALTGYSMNDYVSRARVNKAKEYLSRTDKKVTEVAALVGFVDSRYFSTVFKKIEGKSPSQFKEENHTC